MTAVDNNYTGHVDPRTAARRTLPGASIVKISVGPMDNNAYLVTCSADRRDATDRRRQRRRPCSSWSAARPRWRRSSPPTSTRPLAGTGGRGRGDRRADRRARARRRPAAGPARPVPPPATPSPLGEVPLRPSSTCAATRRAQSRWLYHGPPSGHGHPLFTGDSLFPAGRQDRRPGDFGPADGRPSSRVFEGYDDYTSSTPVTGTTRRWVPNAPTWANGASGAGRPGL